MIYLLTTVQIIDNSGGIIGRCIKILSPHNRNYAKLGDVILISIIKSIPSSKIKKGEIYKAVVVRTTSPSNHISFSNNSVILVKTNPKTTELTPIGSAIKGILPDNLKYKIGCYKLLSLAKFSI